MAITLCLCRLPPSPNVPAPLSGLCRIFPCSTLLSLLSHQRPLVKVAGVACSAMRVDSISNISIHPSIHPPVHLPMTRQLRTSERPTAVHCMSTSTGYPFSTPRSPSLCANKCNYVFELYSKYTRATHAPSLGDSRLTLIVPRGGGFSRQFQPGNFPAVSVIRFANRISRLDIDDIGENDWNGKSCLMWELRE